MGPGRHICRGGRRRYTDANATALQPRPYGNSIGDGHTATDANTEGGAIRKAAPNASAQAIDIPVGFLMAIINRL